MAMANKAGGRNWWRIGIFTAAFIVSCMVLFFFLLVLAFSSMMGGAEPPNGPIASPEPAVSWIPLIGAATTALTAVSSLTGLVLSLRRDKRDGRKSDLELRQLEINLERSELEVEAMEKGSGK